jgi:hypothetical protein
MLPACSSSVISPTLPPSSRRSPIPHTNTNTSRPSWGRRSSQSAAGRTCARLTSRYRSLWLPARRARPRARHPRAPGASWQGAWRPPLALVADDRLARRARRHGSGRPRWPAGLTQGAAARLRRGRRLRPASHSTSSRNGSGTPSSPPPLFTPMPQAVDLPWPLQWWAKDFNRLTLSPLSRIRPQKNRFSPEWLRVNP